MVICPHCAYPFTGDSLVVAERGVECTRCNWKGSSSKLIMVDEDKVLDPRVFDKLYFFLHKEIAPLVGRALIQFGIITAGSSPQEVERLALVLRDYTSSGFEALVRGVLTDGRTTEDHKPVPSS